MNFKPPDPKIKAEADRTLEKAMNSSFPYPLPVPSPPSPFSASSRHPLTRPVPTVPFPSLPITPLPCPALPCPSLPFNNQQSTTEMLNHYSPSYHSLIHCDLRGGASRIHITLLNQLLAITGRFQPPTPLPYDSGPR
jgi:hypothetical protein